MPQREQQNRTAQCADVAELLPVYLNRSLEPAAARRVEAHLAACASCRREERGTRTAWALYEGHLPVELLLDLALEQPMSSRRRAVIESHLAACARCSEEVAVVRQEHIAVGHGQDATAVAPSATAAGSALGRPRATGLRTLALAASIAAFVGSAGWIWTWRQLTEQRALSAAPRVNLPVVELLPATQSLLQRSGAAPGAAANRVQLPDDPDELVLVLLSGGRWCEAGCALEVYAVGEAQPRRRVEGLAATPDGHVTLAVPGDWLPKGRTVLAVRAQATGELVAEYLVDER